MGHFPNEVVKVIVVNPKEMFYKIGGNFTHVYHEKCIDSVNDDLDKSF